MRRVLVLLAMVTLTIAGMPAGEAAPTVGGHKVGDDVVDTAVESDHQHGSTEGHLPGSSKNVELVGQLTFRDAAPGRIADVFAFGNFAYLGAYFEPSCQRGGVYVVDISDPSAPREAGFIQTAQDTYVSEGVQVIHVDTPKFEGDVLIHNNESCGREVMGGVSLWDVSDPLHPRALATGVGDFTVDGRSVAVANEVHSAFAWDAGDKAFVILVDDEEALDVDILDITDPRDPMLIKETGLPDWRGAQNAQSQGTGAFAASSTTTSRSGSSTRAGSRSSPTGTRGGSSSTSPIPRTRCSRTTPTTRRPTP